MRILLPYWPLLALLGSSQADSLPYNPTRILLPPNSSYAYVFQPSTHSANQASLHAVNIDKSFASNALSSSTIFDALPFTQDGSLVSYTPILGAAGNITVIGGNCSEGANATSIWRFSPHSKSSDGNGTWTKETVSTSSTDLAGSNFLSSGAGFTSSTASNATNTDFYVFGGMCPCANSTSSTWISNANYSNTMLALTARRDSVSYDMAAVTGGGQPIAEAGFSMTGLTPSYSQSNSNAPKLQQQEFLFLGGHTPGAFLNISQAALFALPQRTWSFFPVQQPGPDKTNPTTVEPRSGHTAILSEDGSSVIVFGGWVGDISNPAQPQLAVLNLGPGYGGDINTAWSWSVPDQSGDGLVEGTGIYGHGATMLPGGVMMVLGGYSISASTSSRTKRAAQAANTGVLLYNVTSGSWLTSYKSPNAAADPSSEPSAPPNPKSLSQQTKLGVGLAFGVLGLVALIVLGYWFAARRRRRREQHERQVMSHPANDSVVSNQDHNVFESGSIDGRGGQVHAGSPFLQDRERVASGGHGPPPEMESAGSTGLFIDVPSPTHGLRRGLANRPYMYHAAPRHEDPRMSRVGAGAIHPIEEQEDEDDHSSVHRHVTITEPAEQDLGVRGALLQQLYDDVDDEMDVISPIANPFLDPDPHPNPLGSNPLTPLQDIFPRPLSFTSNRADSPQRRPTTAETGISENWTSFGDDEPLTVVPPGRRSPTKSDDRTSSTLSDHSHRSHDSTISIARTMSTRTGALLTAAFAGKREGDELNAGASSLKPERMDTVSAAGSMPRFYARDSIRISPSNDSPSRYLQPASQPTPEKSTESFMTARTTFAQLQTQGEALLLREPSSAGATIMDRDDPYQRAVAAQRGPSSASTVLTQGTYRHTVDLSASASQHRRQGWVGSLRRALTAISNSERSFSMTSSAVSPSEERPHILGLPSRTSTTSRPGGLGAPRKTGSVRTDGGSSIPRRTVSDGSTLVMKQKRGRKDWNETPELFFDPAYSGQDDPGDWGEPRTSSEQRQAEEEWDVESAAEKRDVQIMFTVPKSRLRVVNVDLERASMRSASDGAMSRSESVRRLERRESELRLRKQQSQLLLRDADDAAAAAIARSGHAPNDTGWNSSSSWRDEMASEVTAFGGSTLTMASATPAGITRTKMDNKDGRAPPSMLPKKTV